ncbi:MULTISPECIES: type II toxin-antitoxin system RelE family toxin [unclassified Coleofasciculus]|uniref:type II toxin-antitoxin system RelE family toxin n=1 Tax=unclassified Coleofasciculus TaxID=2692782 RepID=UPI00187F1A3A|nr:MULTISPECIES: type II toxin-antitoxin system RelE/ParE family toxin [unclassified Coleofasciculus]MBE9128612.1 type II toxin-antitoxin system RelE/ParE family toxin [Coleofasciculus sp. LEGE 07081]MBE9151442.1 type II toxin-antitoxin system RelE/ParE family toxin [Coleofasciculus sp. LEGE 07092]
MNIEFRKSFEKDLGSIRDTTLLQRIRAVIEEVETAENLSEVTNIKKLKGDGDYYRIRVGDYRIGITVNEDTVIFVRVLHRKDVYRYFP